MSPDSDSWLRLSGYSLSNWKPHIKSDYKEQNIDTLQFETIMNISWNLLQPYTICFCDVKHFYFLAEEKYMYYVYINITTNRNNSRYM